jgi:hypothetical protein
MVASSILSPGVLRPQIQVSRSGTSRSYQVSYPHLKRLRTARREREKSELVRGLPSTQPSDRFSALSSVPLSSLSKLPCSERWGIKAIAIRTTWMNTNCNTKRRPINSVHPILILEEVSTLPQPWSRCFSHRSPCDRPTTSTDSSRVRNILINLVTVPEIRSMLSQRSNLYARLIGRKSPYLQGR